MTGLSSKDTAELEARKLTEPFVNDVLHQVDRILASQKFERVQPKARNLLRYVVGKKLLDQEIQINEMAIAVAIDEKGAQYNPLEHTRIRVAAGDLRQRLVEYYAGEGHNEPIEIVLPFGTYVPDIRERRPSVAVAPFENWNLNGHQNHLCSTVSDEIAHRLHHGGGVRVGRASTVEASDPHFRYCLRGSLECRDDSLRLNASLSERSAGRIILSQAFEGRRDDVLKLARQVAAAVLDHLKPANGHFAGGLKESSERFETLQLYQQGRFHLTRRTAVDIRKAISLFEQAIEADGRYALAYSGLADCYLVLSWYEVSPPDRAWFETAKSYALSALSLNSGLPEVHTSLAYAKLLCDFDWAGAEEEFRQAILIQNRYAPVHHWYANLLVMQGRFDEAEQEMKRASHLDSGSIVIRKTLGDPFYYSQRYEQAIDAYRFAIKTDPHFWMAHLFLGWSYQHIDENAKALEEFNCVIAQAGGSSIVQGAIGHLHATSGQEAEAVSIIERLKGQPGAPYVAPHSLAVIYAGLGEKDQAFAWLEACFESRIELLGWIKVDPRFEALRTDPRFDNFLAKIGLAPTKF